VCGVSAATKVPLAAAAALDDATNWSEFSVNPVEYVLQAVPSIETALIIATPFAGMFIVNE
jgi:hypothetical protein